MSSPFLTAFFDPLNLMILFLAAAAGLVAAWWLFPLGLLVWLIMMITLTRDPGFRLGHAAANRAPLAQRYQSRYNEIKRAQISLWNAVSSFNASTRPELQPVLNAVNDLMDGVYNLCQRMSGLENYRLVSTVNSNLQDEVNQLSSKIESANDTAVKREYQDALAAMNNRIAKLQDASMRLEKVDAELSSIANEMSAEVTEILQLQSLPHDQISGKIPEITKRIEERAKSINNL
jgi:hypothetical protein